MKIQESAVKFAKKVAEKVYYTSIVDQYIPWEGVARNILQNLAWASDKSYTEEFWVSGDDFGYDYYLRVDGNTAHLKEVKNSTGYVNHIEIICDTIENASDALRCLYVD